MTIEDLVDIEQIKKLKAKYLRLMDQRRWDEWIELFAEESTIRVTLSDQEFCLWRGKAEILAGNSGHNSGNVSIHHGQTPDIDIRGGDRATGFWQLQDTYLRAGRKDESFGYYEDEYVKVDGAWKIRAINCHLYPAQPLPE
jgi:glycine/D-amino acid oxidase-like deaminating enzyme